VGSEGGVLTKSSEAQEEFANTSTAQFDEFAPEAQIAVEIQF
jgi:hypothetical protein